MTVSTSTPATSATRSGPFRPAALTGAGFVAAVLVGNTLTGSTGGGGGALGELTAWAGSPAAAAGLVAELVGFVLLLGFVPVLSRAGRGEGDAAAVAVVAGGVAAAVKLGSGALLLGALHGRDALDEASASALLAANDAAFVLFWIGFGLFVAAGARGLAATGAVGGVLGVGGQVLGSLTLVAGVAGAVVPALAVPIPFLLTLVWTVVVSVRLTIGTGRPEFGASRGA